MTSRDPTAWMWVQACEMLEKAERLHKQFFQLHRISAKCPAWEPPVDIFETEDKIKIVVVLPGVPKERVDVISHDGMLTISGERPLPIDPTATLIHRLEIPYGRFERHIKLPPGDYEVEQSKLINGCLTLSLHKVG